MASLIKRYLIPKELRSKRLSKEEKKKLPAIFYIQHMVSGKAKRVTTGTESLQIAKEKLRQFETAQARGEEHLLPTRTPIADVLTAYFEHIRTTKTAKTIQTDMYYLRDTFGPVCKALTLTSRKLSTAKKKRPPRPRQDRRRNAPVIAARYFEAITTAQISTFIDGQMTSRGLAPKTGNRIRDTLSALFSWAMKSGGILMPGKENPVANVEKRPQPTLEIIFMTHEQITKQLEVLKDDVKMQAMVATMIFAGLRREELLWLRPEDLLWDRGPHGVIKICTKTVDGERWCAKTKKNRRIPISSQLRPYLDNWLLRNETSKWLFPTTTGGRYDPDNFSRRLRDMNEANNLPWTNLDYRHTFASILACRGESLFLIAKLMGNSYQIVEKHYADLNDDALISAVEFHPPTPGAWATAAAV